MRNLKFILFLGIILLLDSCKTQNLFHFSPEKENEEIKLDSIFRYRADYQHIIEIDNKVNISVWGQDELSIGSVYGIYNSNEVYGKWLMVDANGNIEIPKIGTMMVKGMTLPMLKDSIKSLISQWIANPIVDVKVMNKEITLLGEFRNPAVIHVDKDNNSLLELVAKAGGFEYYANLKSIKVLRQDGPKVKIANIDLTIASDEGARNIQLRPGDIIIAPSKKNKEFDKRISTIIPIATSATSAAILIGAF
ncbi:MAG: polysaccharide export protein [Saprospiraceae bacterium]|jgi:polysaccharide export outer membrane protein|nr:polysaccharide export protein [Saprospiraceae bacterium]HLO56286.1 polysaccharide biosynthesis/export family protein [Saprospiraceae bacterium]